MKIDVKRIGIALLGVGLSLLAVAAVAGAAEREVAVGAVCNDGIAIVAPDDADPCRTHGGAAELLTSPTDDDSTAVTVLKGIGTALLLAGGAFLVEARRNVGRAERRPVATSPVWAPPTPEPDRAEGAGAPGAPATLGGVAPYVIHDTDPDVEYLDDELATADGVLLELGVCSECGAPNRVRTNRSTGVRFLVCSTAPACSGTDVLRRATRPRA
jgi:hypothetical protein